MIELRKARINESEEILNFYRDVILSIRGSEFKPKWNSSYPNLEFIRDAILKEELYVCCEDDCLIAGVVINDEFGENYGNVEWHVNAKPDEIIVIHTFAVKSSGNGTGKEIFRQIVEWAVRNDRKTIRIDIIDGNTGAQKVFEKLGFEYVDSVNLFHYAVGMAEFHLYEFIIK